MRCDAENPQEPTTAGTAAIIPSLLGDRQDMCWQNSGSGSEMGDVNLNTMETSRHLSLHEWVLTQCGFCSNMVLEPTVLLSFF